MPKHIEMTIQDVVTMSDSASASSSAITKTSSEITFVLATPLRIRELYGLPSNIRVQRTGEKQSIVHRYETAITPIILAEARKNTDAILDYIFSITRQETNYSISTFTQIKEGDNPPKGWGTVSTGMDVYLIFEERDNLDLTSIFSGSSVGTNDKIIFIREYAAFKKAKEPQYKLGHAYVIIEKLQALQIQSVRPKTDEDPTLNEIRAFRNFTHHLKLDSDHQIKIIENAGISDPRNFNHHDVEQIGIINRLIPKFDTYLREALEQNGITFNVNT